MSYDCHALHRGGETRLKMDILDETGMCVVPTEQIKRRLATMDPEEQRAVDEISVHFLYGLSRLAHTHDIAKIKDVCISMGKLALETILNTEGAAGVFKTLREDPAIAAATKVNNDKKKNNSERVWTALLDSAANAFNPASILSFVGGQVGCNNMDQCIEKIPAVLGNTNPLYLEETVWLECCTDTNCSCHHLSVILDSDPEYLDPSQLIPAFLACMNHKRVYGETSGFEAHHKTLNEVLKMPSRRNRVVKYPLGKVLRACLGGEEASMEYISKMPIEDRAFASMVYMFLFFSRYVNVNMSGDLINRLLYTVVVKILLKCAETLFCEHENSSRSVDGGMFIQYVAGYLTTVIMGCPFVVERAFEEWRNNRFSGPILTMVHNKWRDECGVDDVSTVSDMFIRKVNEMAKKSRYCGKMPGGVECTLGSSRSVRNREHYLPYGQYRINRGQGGTFLGATPENGIMLGMSKQHSNGSNMPCNTFSVLPVIPPLVNLGPEGIVDQAKFESAFFGEKSNEDNSGRLLGFITAMIDKLFLNRFQNALSDDNKADERIRKAIADAVSDCLFDRSRVVDGYVMNNVYTLPPSNQIDAPINRREGIASIDVGRSSVFMQWRRPNVCSPNISALGVSQLELSMSRDPMWAPVLTRLYFFIERISAQITHRMVSSIYGPDSTISDEQRGSMVSDKNILLNVLNNAILDVKKEWIKGEGGDMPTSQRAPTGSKRSFDESSLEVNDESGVLSGVRANISSKIYSCLRDICITNDYNPQVIIGYTPSLILFSKDLEDFVATVTVNPACFNII